MNESTIDSTRLKELTGYRRQSDVERWCRAQGVRFFPGRNGIWTTVAALNTALGISADNPADRPKQKIEF